MKFLEEETEEGFHAGDESYDVSAFADEVLFRGYDGCGVVPEPGFYVGDLVFLGGTPGSDLGIGYDVFVSQL